MGFQSDVIFIDKQVLLNTYADLGIKGLDVYASRSTYVFYSEELLTELGEAVGGTSTFAAIIRLVLITHHAKPSRRHCVG